MMNLQPLDKILRNKLECVIKEARDVAEAGACASIIQLGVGDSKSGGHLTDIEKELRRKLRIHGRQLGDTLCPTKETQEVNKLIDEVAYQHWHRMLFARFLAENNLLMYHDSENSVAVTLEECEDLAKEEGLSNGWVLAARFASRMLPQIFQTESPVFHLALPPEYQQGLERLLIDLPSEVFHASDSLGWVYQYWQTKKKKEVNESEVKIGAKELPAVTQLFTEPYMVSFLLDNSLGAWWAMQRLTEIDFKNAKNEEELRKKASIPGVDLDYLRFVKSEDGKWLPASGSFDKWPDKLTELKTIDPCCGSGHFLVSALLMLVPMRMEMEGVSAKMAIDAVLRENIHGLELDQRCVELAAFALALTAWKYPNTDGYRPLPELNIACSGLSVSVAKEEWKQLGLGKKNLTIALGWLHDTFADATVLGSLINPARANSSEIVQWEELSSALKNALTQEQSVEQLESTVVAHGLAKAAALLAGKYQWVITNVPYLSSGKQCKSLRGFCERYYPDAKTDLATVFLDRCLELCEEGGISSLVLPQNWLFLEGYKKFREKLLRNDVWHLIARLGPRAFETISGEIVKGILFIIGRGNTFSHYDGLFSGAINKNLVSCLDVSESRTATEKAVRLVTVQTKSISQANQLKNPGSRVVLEDNPTNLQLLEKYANGLVGIQTGDDPRYLMMFWEMTWKNGAWVLIQGTANSRTGFAGFSWVLYWENGRGNLTQSKGCCIRGINAIGKVGVAIHRMGTLFSFHYSKTYFHQNIALVIPKNSTNLPAIWCFCSSPEYNEAVRRIDQKLNVTNATLVKVPFDLGYWGKVAEEKYPNGLPKPYSNDPTQWIFHGHPCGSVIWNEDKKWTNHGPLRIDANVLQVAVIRMLGYRWPAELDSEMELADEQRNWVNRCGDLLRFADETGIVCIPPVRGEDSAADRLLNILVASYGDEWSNEIRAELLKQVDHADKTLDSWLRDKFFAQHCQTFHQRPFIWHIWDGLQDGFAALLNYHKLNRKNLEILIYTYLGDWIKKQKDDCGKVDGAEERLAAAENLKKKLELILDGEEPYDIFIRWKPIEEQSIGWNPNINDGVRLNIRPFMLVPDIKKKGAGVLREKPNIKWDKDRGRDVESAPWFSVFGGDRINDKHLTLTEKRIAYIDKKGGNS